MIKKANFHGIGISSANLQLVACSSDQFAKQFNVSKGKQLREVELPDKEQFDIVVDSTKTKFALMGADQLNRIF
ncbi:MAG: hypothetical protein EZS28_042620 [Streblomastix strix]|uniref:Uncharacterized protein n=1 Tax=Streblomastix strix TaxID=222440 RepID=A0A5J4TVB2_9EUKA|nr:MAG: hypothetical protein EZS28_042620 [Streblomastix strix]